MKNFQFSSILLSIVFCLLFSSCAKEESPVIQSEPVFTVQTAEDYLASNDVPAIMFSYNSYDPETNLLSSWLIDNEGNIRAAEIESDIVYEVGSLSPYYMDTKKNRSVKSESNVDLEELVENFKSLHTASKLTYDLNAASDNNQELTSVYGYYYSSSTHGESCGCDTSGSEDLQMYDAVLLEQKVGAQVIQTNHNASLILEWINALIVQGE